jgi:hypothetical protein
MDATGSATWTTSSLTAGQHAILASYNYFDNFAASSASLTETITTPPPFTSTVIVTGGPVAAGGTATLTASVIGNGYSTTPTGSVTFSTGTATLSTESLVAGVATLNAAATVANGLVVGEDEVTASYSGDTNFQSSVGSFDLLIYNPAVPLLLSLSPGSATPSGAGFTLTVNGANFAVNSQVLWNGALRTTTHVSNTELAAAILAPDIAKEGTKLVTVATPARNVGTSAAQPFLVISATPVATISDVLASDTAAGDYILLALTGSDFVSSSVVEWNGNRLTTIYVSPWQITALVTGSDYASPPATVLVANPSGTSVGFDLP